MSNTPPSSTRSFRCPDDLWDRANERARSEGVRVNRVINEILEGYASGDLNLPRLVRVFEEQKKVEKKAPARKRQPLSNGRKPKTPTIA